MKKFLSILVSFGFIGSNSSSLFACLEQIDDPENESSMQTIKTDLQLAKQFISTNHLTVDTIFANESVETYIDYLRIKHQNDIKSDINFLFTENEFEGLAQGEQQIIAILNHQTENETVNVKFTILDDAKVANNILDQAVKRLQENIKANSLLATSTLDQVTIDKIINLIKSQISNNDVQVNWNANSTLTTLESNKENKVQVDLAVKKEASEFLLASKTIDVTLIDVSESLEIVNQKLLDTAEQKLFLLDGQGLSENDDLSSLILREEIIELLKTILNNPQINISLLNQTGTLKENNNKIKVKLIINSEKTQTIERNITVTFSNIISLQKQNNIVFLKEQLPEILKTVDGSNLSSDFSINNSEVWKLINAKINDSNVKAIAPPILKRSTVTIQHQSNIVSNNLRGFGRLFGRTMKSRKTIPKSKISKPKKVVKKTTKTTKSTSIKQKPTKIKKDPVKTKDKPNTDPRSQKDKPEQDDRIEQIESLQEKIEQAEALSQSFIDQLVDNDIYTESNEYNIFALTTVGFGEDAVTDIIPVKFINISSNN